jgi:hypothetical protein
VEIARNILKYLKENSQEGSIQVEDIDEDVIIKSSLYARAGMI